MRTQLKTEGYFVSYISGTKERAEKFLTAIKTGQAPPERIIALKQQVAASYLRVIIAKYSAGHDREALKDDYVRTVEIMNEGWVNNYGKVAAGEPQGSSFLDLYYLDKYEDMLWVLSLGVLLNMPKDVMAKLVNIIDRDKVKDMIYETIIRFVFPERAPLMAESSTEKYLPVTIYAKLRQAINETDKAKASELIKEFLEKDWFSLHKDAGWYNSHKSQSPTFFGYWSFESAAIVKIKGLDDSAFIKNEYYPGDLVK